MAIKIDQPITEAHVSEEPREQKLAERPAVVAGVTHKLRRPGGSMYVTINRNAEGEPIEVFANSRNLDQSLVGVTRLISMAFRARIPAPVIVEELKAIRDPDGGYFVPGGGGYVGSTMAHLGKCLEAELCDAAPRNQDEDRPLGKRCPECGEHSVVTQEGCEKCLSCGDSKCG